MLKGILLLLVAFIVALVAHTALNAFAVDSMIRYIVVCFLVFPICSAAVNSLVEEM